MLSKSNNKLQHCNALISNPQSLKLALIILCALFAYSNTIFNDFVYDDNYQIIYNTWITNVKHLPEIFSNDATHAETAGSSNYYRPIMNTVYMFNYYLFRGLTPWGFHLVNVLLHIGVTILVFFTTSALFDKARSETNRSFFSAPLLVAIIFAVHPINSEVVAWVACVPELTFALFCLLAFYFHMKSLRNFDSGRLLSLAFFAVALLCKETSVTLLPILAVYDYLYRDDDFKIRRYILRYTPFVLIIGLYLVLRINALGGMAPSNRHPELNTFELIINILPLFSQYLGKLLLPINLNAFYVLHPVHSVFEPGFLISFVTAGAFLALGVVMFKKNKHAFLGLVIITAPLLPVLYIRGLGENTFADRYLYFPSIGFALLAGSLLTAKVTFGDQWRKALSILLIIILGIYSIGSIKRNRIWHDDLTLWTDTIKKSPDCYIPLQSYGAALLKAGRYAEALPPLEKAIRLEPQYEQSYISLADVYIGLGLKGKALEVLKNAVRVYPHFANCHNNLGYFFLQDMKAEEAIKEFEAAVKARPNFINPYTGLGLAYAELGLKDKSFENYEVALRLDPGNQAIRNDYTKVLQFFSK
jgi:protein O-mannosyl-transferase